jgi:nucleotide-binding universal stress UspA family protein
MKGFHHTRLFGHIDASTPTTAGQNVDPYAVAQGQTCEDPRPVLVAVDGSKTGWEALDWAAAEAVARRCELGVVHEFAWPLSVDSFGVLHARVYDPATVRAAEDLVAEAVRRAHQVAPELDVETHLQVGERTSGICREAEECALMVLGRHQPRVVLGLRRDRSQHIPRRASCSVAVVGLSHGVVSGPAAARVIVGVDHPGYSASALGFAFRAARRRRVGVTVLHVWSPRGQSAFDGWGFVGWADEPPSSELEKRRQLDALLAGWRDAFPDVEIRQRLIRGPVGPALVAESDSAALLVVASRGRRPLRTTLMGSVSGTVLRSAHCPVAVVRRSQGADEWVPR